MILKDVLKGLDYIVLNGDINRKINRICYDNRKIEQEDVFVCIKGFKVDGHSFVEDAIKKGAKAIIVQEDVSTTSDVSVIKVKNTRQALAVIASNFYDNPKDKLNIIGITGTNGKTTSAFIIKSILEKAGYKTGLMGTIANYIGNEKIDSVRTTPESLELHELFNEMVQKGVKYCVMEVSSHSLALDRVYGVKFICGIFTNLTRDHLDFHKTFENYYMAKAKLFERSNYSIINIDDSYGRNLIEDIKKKNINTLIKTISIESEADFKACKINGDSLGSRFKMEAEGNIYNIEINIPGLYNVHNVLGCIACARNLNISMETIKEAVLDIVVPGRCEMVAKNKNLPYTIIVDYAHTPDGLENILNTIRGFVKGKIITVFGCGGDRDKVKRPQMGEIACKLSDIAIITSDNPRSEEPMAIIEDIKNGLAYNNYIVEENRAKAIEKAIDMAKQNDVILIAGKGHETYQILKDKTIHFDEREVIVDILNKKEK